MKQLLTTILFLLALTVSAQPPRPSVVNYTPKDYGSNQSPENLCIFQDNRGYIFAGNSYGLIMYDGNSWSFIEVQPGSYVTAIDQASDGRIYVGTSNGEFGYLKNDKRGNFVFQSLAAKFGKDQPLTETVRLHCIGKDIYLQTANHLFYINEAYKVQTVPTETSFHLVFKANNTIYAREREVGLISIEKTQKKVLSDINDFKNYGLFGVLPYDQHHLLVITQERGLWLYNQENRTSICLNSDSLTLKKYRLYGGISLHDGKYALNTLMGGLLIINHEGQIESHIDKSTGLRVNDIKQVIQDKHRNLWLAMSNGIALVNYGSSLHTYDEGSGLRGGSECVIYHQGSLYAGTSEGLFVEDPRPGGDKYFMRIPEVNSHVWAMAAYGNKLLVATDDGLFISHEKSFRKIQDVLINAVTVLDDQGLAVTAGKDAMYLIDLKNGKIFPEAYFDFSIPRVIAIKKDPSSTPDNIVLWTGTVGSGIIKTQLSGTELTHEYFNNLDEASLVMTRPVIINNKIYFATSGGLRQMVQTGKEKAMFDFADISPEFNHPHITDLFQTGKRIWVCANNKVFYIEKGKSYKTPFMPIDRGRINNIFPLNDRTCWVAAADGLVRYSEPKKQETNLAFDIALRSFSIGNDSLIFGGHWQEGNNPILQQPADEKIVLPYRYNNCSFVFSALYYSEVDKVSYSHMLEGHDNNWSSWSADNKIKYTKLHEGDYVFKVKARNVYGKESQVTEFRFSVSPPWYRTITAYVLYVLAGCFVFYIVFQLFAWRLKQRNEQLEQTVKKRTAEIALKNEELHSQYEQINHQKKEITDSINYAKKIQEAMMPFLEEMKKNLPDSFILFKPKDIVSGDFYWVGKVDHKLILICADCTGHGVPGAFMSMLCIDKLNHIIGERKIYSPDRILEEANKSIKKSLGQTDEQNLRTKDGMDCAVMMLDTTQNKLYYAGANRPLWYIRNNEVQEIKPDKCAVGGFTPEEQTFTLNELVIEKGDCFYTSTDGYADQFGGPRGKKLMVKTFKESLVANALKNFDQQHDFLDNQIEEWKGHGVDGQDLHEQVDDICVMGFKVF